MDPRLRVRPVGRITNLVVRRRGGLVHHHHHGHQVVVVAVVVVGAIATVRTGDETARAEPVGTGVESVIRPETALSIGQSRVDEPSLLLLLLLLELLLELRLLLLLLLLLLSHLTHPLCRLLKLPDLISRKVQNLLLGEPGRIESLQERVQDLGSERDVLRVDVVVAVEVEIAVVAEASVQVVIGSRTEVRVESARAERHFIVVGVITLSRLILLGGELFLEDRHELERSWGEGRVRHFLSVLEYRECRVVGVWQEIIESSRRSRIDDLVWCSLRACPIGW